MITLTTMTVFIAARCSVVHMSMVISDYHVIFYCRNSIFLSDNRLRCDKCWYKKWSS